MNYGKWFTFDHQCSDLKNGITVFNYRGFKFDKEKAKLEVEKESDGDITTPRYPIFATISAIGVHFCCHYALLSPELESEKDNDGTRPIYHQNNMILSLEFTGNNHEQGNLLHSINDAFCAIYPQPDYALPNTGVLFLSQLKEQIIKGADIIEETKGITYSTLDVFRTKRIGEEDSELEFHRFVVRKLFLDFLYDFEHTDVFQNSPYYDTAYARLHEDFLFDAIAQKADFYYHRKICQKLIAQSGMAYNNKSVLEVNIEHYAQAEQRWVERIIDSRADKLFYESDWLISTNQELDAVYKSVDSCADLLEKLKPVCIDPHDEDRINELARNIRISAERAYVWYLRKYDLGGALYVLFGRRTPILWISTCIPPLLLLARRTASTRISIRTLGSIEMFMPRMFAAIFAAWFTLYSFVDKCVSTWMNPVHHGVSSAGWINMGIFVTIGLMFAFLYSEIKRKTRYTFEDHNTDLAKKTYMEGTIIKRVIAILVIGLEYSALASLFIFKITKLSGSVSLVFFAILLVMFVGIFVQMIFDDKSVSESFINDRY